MVDTDIKAKDEKIQGLVKKNEKLQGGLEKKDKDFKALKVERDQLQDMVDNFRKLQEKLINENRSDSEKINLSKEVLKEVFERLMADKKESGGSS